MKNRLFFLGLLALSFNFKSQMWGPATPFPAPSGTLDFNGSTNHSTITSLSVWNNDLYVCGDFTSIGGIVAHGIAKWNGNSWSSLGQGNFLQQPVGDAVVFNGAFYFTSDRLYKWDGNSLQVFTYFNTSYQIVKPVSGSDLHVFNNELYIVNTEVGLLKFNGNDFTEINDNNQIGLINCVESYSNSIYVGTDQGLFKYQTGNWINCNGITTEPPIIYDLETFNNELYVLGYYSSIGGISVNGFSKFNGSTWNYANLPDGNYPQTLPFGSWNVGTNHLHVMNNALYFAHTFSTWNTNSTFKASPLIKYDGSQWSQIALNGGLGGACSVIYNNELYVGGNYPGIASQNFQMIPYFAKLDPNALSVDSVPDNREVSIFPNPTAHSITIKGEKSTNQSFHIYDQMGLEVFKGKLTGTETEVNLSALSKGMYTLKIEGNYQPAQIVKE
ncbi:MAG: T9SS type A sorting domain-containing protein [Crocinitomicaceae bacterium]|nr:T9SS type A sorting domain-containing protein [Crocinitomicaceae bacterium]MCF8445052.1 T9SS type A sorting domain-containing protein [Crocinitomicaceae bacterium]